MTVSTTTTRIHYAGDGASTGFAVPFPFFDPDDLIVIERAAASGAETVLVRGADYTVDGGSGGGGTVTALSAPSTGVEWHILRETPATQAADYRAYDAFPAELHEAALDRAALRAAEARTVLAQALRFPRSDPAALSGELAPAPVRAAHLLGFDGDGAPALYDAGLAALPATAGALIGANAAGDALEEKPGLVSDGTGLTIGGDAVVTTDAAQMLANKTLESPAIVTPALTGTGGALVLPAGPGAMVIQETGNWTPTLEGQSVAGANTYALQTGEYLRIGRLVIAFGAVALSAKDAAMSGNVLLGGLPYPSSAGFGFPSAVNNVSNVALGAGYSQFTIRVRPGNSDAILNKTGDNVELSNVPSSDIGNNVRITSSLIYLVSD